jgi:hypothetical protein
MKSRNIHFAFICSLLLVSTMAYIRDDIVLPFVPVQFFLFRDMTIPINPMSILAILTLLLHPENYIMFLSNQSTKPKILILSLFGSMEDPDALHYLVITILTAGFLQ